MSGEGPVDRLGVLGGTFDPVHRGHLAIARHALAALGLPRVLLVPAGRPPHKPDRAITDAAHRLAMIELAIAGETGLAVSRLEIDRPGPSYAADTMTLLAADRSLVKEGADLIFLLSSEAVAGLPDWHDPGRLLAACRLAVVPRGGVPAPSDDWIERHFPGRADRFIALGGPDVPISGSRIRALAAAGEPLEALVPPAVADYIANHGLYTGDVRRPN